MNDRSTLVYRRFACYLCMACAVTFDLAAGGEIRTWTNRSGKHRVAAEFLDYKEGVVYLRHQGKTLRVAITDFSDEDQAFARENAASNTRSTKTKKNESEKLVQWISKIRATPPPSHLSREQTLTYLHQATISILTAADQLRVLPDIPQKQLQFAMQSKLSALNTLSQIAPQQAAPRIFSFPQELDQQALDRHSLNQLKRSAKSLELSMRLQLANSKDEASLAVTLAVAHVTSCQTLGPLEVRLGQTAAQFSGMVDYGLAAESNEKLAQIFLRDPKYKRIAAAMIGSAKRFRLVGNQMKITGVKIDGERFDMSELQGKVVLVDFWASWCGPCRHEMPNIKANYQKYHDKGFEVVAISLDKDLNALSKYLTTERPPWTVLVDYHPKNSFRLNGVYGITSIPTTILIDDGKVVSLNCRGKILGQELARRLGNAS